VESTVLASTGVTSTGVTSTGAEGSYRPGLDGIRALAVTAVLLFHLDRLDGGNLGVDAFFVVSGWLITWKLLSEADAHDRLDLRRFWSGRARRLMPASFAVLLMVAVVWPLAGLDVPTLRHDLMYAAAWVSNWGTISAGGDYWAHFGEPSPVTHFWSLAIEEQFYLVWPILLAMAIRFGRRRRAAVAAMSLSLAAGSIVLMNTMFDHGNPTATYMNTFARAHSLLLGAAAAAVTTVLADGSLRGGRTARRLMPWSVGLALGIVGGVSLAGRLTSADTSWLYRWGFPLFAVAMVPIVVAAADGAGVRVLGSTPLRWVSDRSYGLYLWHWPVFLLLRPSRLGIDDAALPTLLLDIARVALSVLLADLSFRWLETPVRRRRRLVAWRAPVAAAVSMSVVACLAVTLVPASRATSGNSVVALPPPPDRTVAIGGLPATFAPAEIGGSATGLDRTPGSNRPGEELRTSGPTIGSGTGAGIGIATGPIGDDATVAASSAAPAAPAAPVSLGRPLRVLVTGDSTGVHLSEALLAHAATVPDQLTVGTGAFPGCGLSAAADGRRHAFTNSDRTRELIDISGCVGQFDTLPRRVVDEAVDVVLVKIGPWDAVDIHLADGSVVSVADERGRALVRESYLAFAGAVIDAGARLVWVTPNDTHLGWGAFDDPLNDPERWVALRGIVDELSAELGVVQVDEGEWMEVSGLTGPDARPDGVHLADGLNERLVVERIAPALMEVASTIASGRCRPVTLGRPVTVRPLDRGPLPEDQAPSSPRP
jgi:peptidoglycan/LPS O-acetylase OafA/YrhL